MEKVLTDKVVQPGESPHSQAIIAGGFIFTQGMIYLTPDAQLLEGTLEEKITLIMENLTSVLEEAGASFKTVVKATIFVTDMASYAVVNQVYSKYVSDPFPAREVVCVKQLPLGAEVEISVIAHIA
ncbi:hypothetical protein CO180_04430 [candidate division WWE3 bacterium CG_4_9_14_3_um_filter_41_6]|uniref:Reactive intermediate/imine deaminase n=1 Tax=candidate division WWE3 bacterium CG_4_10_14_0_2_um_filter_41_14 TaxID=1975072 RepID=A0A2M7TF76_UNCKA|nr:MAG: hypothetical protein COY32_06335 [candidate division WWE3 bacterium CG_4_10_14_0_2_um_filter_41_14]PJA38040.1 MAG: hypothetical protein CO180_04430 [candidate division WWE3 bacterium CG_4_9_14_3_um_filter_41_6]